MTNNPSLAGQQAAPKQFFGEFRRYAVYPVHTRFDAVSWFVADGEQLDEQTGLAAIIRQSETKEAAMDGLTTPDGFEYVGAVAIPKMAAPEGWDAVDSGFERLNERLAEIAAA